MLAGYINQLVYTSGGQIVTDSIIFAKFLKINHKKLYRLTRDIKKCGSELKDHDIIPASTEVETATKKLEKNYFELSRNGFETIISGLRQSDIDEDKLEFYRVCFTTRLIKELLEKEPLAQVELVNTKYRLTQLAKENGMYEADINDLFQFFIKEFFG